VAQGKEGPYSDIDLMIVGSVAFESVVAAIQKPQEDLGRAINPVILRPHDFNAKRDAGDGFVSRVMGEPKIMLLGTFDEPGKSA
jgi:predicted nucleotidyltransferase